MYPANIHQFFFNVADILNLVDKPAVNAGCLNNCFYSNALHQRVFNSKYAIPFRYFNVFDQFIAFHQTFSVITQAQRLRFQGFDKLFEWLR